MQGNFTKFLKCIGFFLKVFFLNNAFIYFSIVVPAPRRKFVNKMGYFKRVQFCLISNFKKILLVIKFEIWKFGRSETTDCIPLKLAKILRKWSSQSCVNFVKKW